MLNRATMIIACPACATRYVVPDSAIGVEGRTVRCAKCRHSWFQDGPELAAPPPAPAPVPPSPPADTVADGPPQTAGTPLADDAVPPADQFADAPDWTIRSDGPAAPAPEAAAIPVEEAAPPPAQPADAPAAEPPPAEPALPDEPTLVPPPPVYDDVAPPAVDDGDSSFAHEPPFRPRRNPARMWMIAAVLFAVIALSAVAATALYGLPDWFPFARSASAGRHPDLKLDFPKNRQDHHQLANGTWFFGANGSVTNVGQSPRTVPPILIVLRDEHGRNVYSWEAASPKRVLAPGESVSINEAVTDAPKSAVSAEFSWKQG